MDRRAVRPLEPGNQMSGFRQGRVATEPAARIPGTVKGRNATPANPCLRKRVIPFGAAGYVAQFENRRQRNCHDPGSAAPARRRLPLNNRNRGRPQSRLAPMKRLCSNAADRGHSAPPSTRSRLAPRSRPVSQNRGSGHAANAPIVKLKYRMHARTSVCAIAAALGRGPAGSALRSARAHVRS